MAITLDASKRVALRKAVKELREEGILPAILYGAKEESSPIQVSIKEFGKVWKDAGESSVISLSVDGEKKDVLIYDVDLEPLTHQPRHVDFYVIQKGQKLEVSVPLSFVGESPAVKEKGANLIKVLHELEVEADATNLPHEIAVDIVVLVDIDQQILAQDIPLPDGVTLVTKPEEVVAIASEPEEEKDEAPTEIDMSAIGMSEEKGKKEEEEGGDSAPSEEESKSE
ncbi:50S ribosomal protein L25 [Candidatus Kaiserbacteria bacterium CG10_big_fil_rev_8_21_14_0_10_45_20]|uniref:Large ribosomal subunit protein bL25 n=1 Tax=Candidatus Kaiserbacteria bacterium CG10_big_fil_rev_8_21_14_0_10_45_20 TaxID=1974607 RepID=A0A2H0UEW2_9BACT|nr:MAG: 50S ribosomal protein L25 [Candidatus Kaiserbacteria bacterium CG10_big_fil_rev_8_21_14_0_10_45_20]